MITLFLVSLVAVVAFCWSTSIFLHLLGEMAVAADARRLKRRSRKPRLTAIHGLYIFSALTLAMCIYIYIVV